MSRRLITLFGLLATLFALAGCRAGSTAVLPESVGVEMVISAAPNPPTVGQATLIVSLHSIEDDAPIDDAAIAIRGDMNHAGMIPVLRETDRATDGDYSIPFEWTMGGDWFVVVTATLSDGTVIEQAFPFAVSEVES